jgi:hypothetical protein
MKIRLIDIGYVVAAIILLFSVLAAAVFFTLTKDQDLRADLLRNGSPTSGKIIDMGGSRGRTSFVDLELHAHDGRIVKTTYRSGFPFPERDAIAKGMNVNVVYDPADPSRAIPAPFGPVIQRDVMAELLGFLRRIGLALLLCSPVIVASAFYIHWRSRSSMTLETSLKPPPKA